MAASHTLSGSQTQQTKVDRRCNAAMMPWIIEELQWKAREMARWGWPLQISADIIGGGGREVKRILTN